MASGWSHQSTKSVCRPLYAAMLPYTYNRLVSLVENDRGTGELTVDKDHLPADTIGTASFPCQVKGIVHLGCVGDCSDAQQGS